MLRGEVNMTKWCNTYGCWCVDVEEITDSQYSCDLNCDDCEDMEKIEYTKGNYKAFKDEY